MARCLALLSVCITAFLLAVWPALAAEPGTVFWTSSVLPAAGTDLVVVDPNSSDTLYARAGGGVARSTDGGLGWTPLRLTGEIVRGIAVSPDSSAVYIATNNVADAGAVFKSTDGGGSWDRVYQHWRPVNGVVRRSPNDQRGLRCNAQ